MRDSEKETLSNMEGVLDGAKKLIGTNEKLQIVLRCLKGEIGLREASRKNGVNLHDIGELIVGLHLFPLLT